MERSPLFFPVPATVPDVVLPMLPKGFRKCLYLQMRKADCLGGACVPNSMRASQQRSSASALCCITRSVQCWELSLPENLSHAGHGHPRPLSGPCVCAQGLQGLFQSMMIFLSLSPRTEISPSRWRPGSLSSEGTLMWKWGLCGDSEL